VKSVRVHNVVDALQNTNSFYGDDDDDNNDNNTLSSIIWYQRKLGSKQAYRMVHQPVSRDFAVFADAWLSGWLAEISADLRETVAH